MNIDRERVVTMLLLAGLTATFVAAVKLPGHRSAEAACAEIAAAAAEIARGPQALAQYKAAQAELDDRLRYLADSAPAVTPVDPHELLGRISRLARASDLTVRRLEPEPDRPQASYTEHPFRLDFRGSLESLAGFLRGLENAPRLFAVEDLTIRTSADGESREDLEGSVRFAVFVERALFAEHEGAAEFSEESGSAAGG